jgi:hypothetical protein
VGHRVKVHNITPETGKERGDVEIRAYVFWKITSVFSGTSVIFFFFRKKKKMKKVFFSDSGGEDVEVNHRKKLQVKTTPQEHHTDNHV